MKTGLDVLSELTKLLEADFPPEAYQQVTFEDGEKGMGLRAQYATDRLNEVLGLGGWSMPNEITYIRKDGEFGEVIEIVCTGYIKIHSAGLNFSTVECDGGGKIEAHQSVADACKSARTQLKSKCCSYLGIGAKAYRGVVPSIDLARRMQDEIQINQIKTDLLLKEEEPTNNKYGTDIDPTDATHKVHAEAAELHNEALRNYITSDALIKKDYELKAEPDIVTPSEERPVAYDMAPDLEKPRVIEAIFKKLGDPHIPMLLTNGMPDLPSKDKEPSVDQDNLDGISEGSPSAIHPVYGEVDQKAILEHIATTHELTKDDIMIISGRSRLVTSFLKKFYLHIEAQEQFPGSEFKLNYDHYPKVSYGEDLNPAIPVDESPKEEEVPFPENLPTSPTKVEETPKEEVPEEEPKLENHVTGTPSFEPMTEKRAALEITDVYDALTKVWGKSDEDDEEMDDLLAELDEMDAKFPAYINPGSVSTTLTKIARVAPQAMIDRLLVVA